MTLLERIYLNTYFRFRKFDAEFYRNTYADIATCGMTPWQQYRKLGVYQNRCYRPGCIWRVGSLTKLLRHRFAFDPEFYVATYPDAAESGITPWEHYCSYGQMLRYSYSRRQHERRRIRSEAKAQLEQTDDDAEVPSMQKPKEPSPQVIPTGDYKQHNGWQTFLAVWAHKLLPERQDVKIAVILHLFYMNSWQEIYSYIRMLKGYKTDFYITYAQDFHDDAVLEQIRRDIPNVHLVGLPNQGFDVGPFLEVLHTLPLENYDIVYKLQSKGTARPKLYMYGQIFKKRDWFLNLYRGLFGFFRTRKVINLLAGDNKIGLVAAKNLIICDPRHKQNMTRAIAEEKLGLKVPRNYHFVAGTCFAIRASLLKPIQDLQLRLDDFAETQRGTFSLAHAMERIICAIVETAGYTEYGLETPRSLYKEELLFHQACDSTRLLDDPRFKLDDEYVYKRLERRNIGYYEVVRIKLGDIRRKWFDGKLYKLTECSPYKYLSGDQGAYEQYCKENAELSGFIMTKERYDSLIRTITENYDEKSMPVLNKDNVLLDGQHRCCILLHRFGPDHEISALRIYGANPPVIQKR